MSLRIDEYLSSVGVAGISPLQDNYNNILKVMQSGRPESGGTATY